MQLEIQIQNYRCFNNQPVKYILGPGFTSFIGKNNSGKSTLLKFFYEFRNIFQQFNDNTGPYRAAINGTGSFEYPSEVKDPAEIFNNTNENDIIFTIKFISDGIQPTWIDKLTFKVIRNSNTYELDVSVNGTPISLRGNQLGYHTDGIEFPGQGIVAEYSHIFEPLFKLSNTLYIGPFRNAVNIGSEEKYYDIQLGEAFIRYWRDLKNGTNRRNTAAAIKIENSIARLFSYSTLQINTTTGDQNLQLIIEDKSYMLSDIGSGISQFILVLTRAAERLPAYILIDEPELNLHPALQRDFLTTLGSFTSEGVLFSSHSIGLARSSAERVYTIYFSGETRRVKPYGADTSLAELLGELSYGGYKDLGYDKVLLVEGRTDVKVVQQFLRYYGKEQKVVLLPLGGDALINGVSTTELNEINRLSDNNISALIDSEKSTENESLTQARKDFKRNCRRLNINCHVLERRAIENYFTESAIHNGVGTQYTALGPYERLSPQHWSKANNYQIAQMMTKSDISSTDLGEFLNQL